MINIGYRGSTELWVSSALSLIGGAYNGARALLVIHYILYGLTNDHIVHLYIPVRRTGVFYSFKRCLPSSLRLVEGRWRYLLCCVQLNDVLSTHQPKLIMAHHPLKVPKREIFDRSDFPDFYTIKSLRVGDFGVKIKLKLKLFRGSFRGAKFLTRMLSLFLRRFFSEFWPKNFFFLWRF